MKRHLLVDARGVPLSLVVTGANRHDSKGTAPVLDAIRIEGPKPGFGDRTQNLCADKAYNGAAARQAVLSRGYRAHIRSRGEEARQLVRRPGRRARRWVVEVCHSWLNRFRKLLVRFEKTEAGALGLLELACAIIAWRQILFSG
jgi:transposase